MSDASFSAVTASFTIGGLLGSLFSDYITNRNGFGRKGAVTTSTVLVGLGSALMTVSSSIPPFFIGRYYFLTSSYFYGT
jgi:MFS family permease